MSVVEAPLTVKISLADSVKRLNFSLKPLGTRVEVGNILTERVLKPAAEIGPDPAQSRLQRGLIVGIGAIENLVYLTARNNPKSSPGQDPEKRKELEHVAAERRRKPSRCVISKPHERGQCPTGQPWRCKSSENYRLDRMRKSARDKLDGTTLAKNQSVRAKDNFDKFKNITVLPSAKAAVPKAA
ncbi:hypothetical protein HYW44_03250 [Candidatus Daviesbacteria bacterium]|nr:hypothetical protein [Candidatus Daviesbacteria bacterium]